MMVIRLVAFPLLLLALDPGKLSAQPDVTHTKVGGLQVPSSRAGQTSPNDFHTEAEARQHCGGREIVWVIPGDRLYFVRSDPAYGRGSQGWYMCRDEAAGDDNRPAAK